MKENHIETEEWLYELGYDNRDYLYHYEEGNKMSLFMRRTDGEIKREAQRYIDFIEDTSDDHYINLKLNAQKMHHRKPFDPRVDSIILT